ncbi:FecR domain-containing protein [Chitinophagaceae bacterium 26-R-25]|nr:FecR domain-containing protein [Chitinophagaceae bacterium 26-R-25]
MARNRLSYLYYQFLNDTASLEELAELKEYFNNPRYQEEIKLLMDQDWNFVGDISRELPSERSEIIYDQIISKKKRVRSIKLPKRMAVAAVLLVALGSISYYFLSDYKANSKLAAVAPKGSQAQDIPSGTNKAILKLANGKVIALNEVKQGELLVEHGSTILKKADGQLVYTSDNQSLSNDKVYLNTIEVPRGGEYKLTLPDGTTVYMNAASSLIYPTRFDARERAVTLSGEAYFEVAGNPRVPFKVNVLNKQSVDVLGTSFNISAYADDAEIRTTLVDGAVKVVAQNNSVVLKPGEMASGDINSSRFIITNIDTAEVLGWKNGYFIFNNESLKSIITKISRWYDVDVTIKGSVDGINVIGNYDRKKTLMSLLKGIELSNNIQFIVKNKKITVIGK